MSKTKLADSQAIIDDLMGLDENSHPKPTVCPDEPIESPMLEAALSYARRGWPVIPLWWVAVGRCQCKKSKKCTSPGKHPFGKFAPNGSTDGTVDEDLIHSWWTAYPDMNIGICTGGKLVGIDIDGPEGQSTLDRLEATFGSLGQTLTAKTGRGDGGRHQYFGKDPNIKIGNIQKDPDWKQFDVRGEGGYLVAPPSRHKTGRKYRWDKDSTALAQLPASWVNGIVEHQSSAKVKKPSSAVQPSNTKKDAPKKEGERDDSMFRYASDLEGKNLSYNEILANCLSVNTTYIPPLEEYEVNRKVDSAWKYRTRRITKLATVYKELEAADVTARIETIQKPEVKDLLRLAKKTDPVTWSKILDLFKSKKWALNDAMKFRAATGFAAEGTLSLSREKFDPNAWADNIMSKSKMIYDDEFLEFNGRYFESKKDNTIKYEVRNATEWKANIRHTTEIMEAMKIKLSHGVRERNPIGLLCLRNGVFNFGTDETFAHSDQLFLTHMVDIDYDKHATFPIWLETLEDILPDPASRLLLQKYAGYSLTSDVHHQKCLYLYGPGGNGKSTIIKVIRALVGAKNCGALSLKDLSSHFMLHKVRGILANFTNEIDSAFVNSDGPFKQIVDGSMITADVKYKEAIEFEPFCKLWIASNSILSSKDTSDGFLRRFLFLDFPVCLTNSEKLDEHRADKIIEKELSGVLNWAIEGLRLLNQEGFKPLPDCHHRLRKTTRSKIHPRSDFFNLYLMEKYGSFVKLQDVVQAYNNYALDMGRIPVSDATIREDVENYFKNRGVDYTRRKNGMGFTNLTFVQPEDFYDLEGADPVKSGFDGIPCQNDIPF